MFFKLKNGVLSNKDIKHEFGKNIFIYPFKEKNLKGSTYNLTASSCAWIVEDSSVGDKETKTSKLIVNKDGDIVIPANKTAIIETDESIFVTGKISGTYHSKVKLCSKGLSHIGTTLDPFYFGTSAIPLHNNTDKPIKIPKNSTIVSIMFNYVHTSADNLHDNAPFRNDIFGSLDIDSFYEFPEETSGGKKNKQRKNRLNILKQINDWKECSWRNNRNDLIKQVKLYIKKNNCHETMMKRVIFTVLITVVLMVIFIILLFMSKPNSSLRELSKILLTVCIPSASLIVGVFYKSYDSNRNIDIDA